MFKKKPIEIKNNIMLKKVISKENKKHHALRIVNIMILLVLIAIFSFITCELFRAQVLPIKYTLTILFTFIGIILISGLISYKSKNRLIKIFLMLIVTLTSLGTLYSTIYINTPNAEIIIAEVLNEN